MALAMAWSVLRPPAPSSARQLSPSMPNCERRREMENGECRFMCVFMAPVFRAPSVADCQRRTGLGLTVDFK